MCLCDFVCTYVYIIYVQRKNYKVLQFNSSFSIAESSDSHPKCRRHCWITGSTKALPQWTRQAVQRWHGKDAVGQIDVEISCWPGWSKIMMVGFLGVLLLWKLRTNLFHHGFIRSFFVPNSDWTHPHCLNNGSIFCRFMLHSPTPRLAK